MGYKIERTRMTFLKGGKRTWKKIQHSAVGTHFWKSNGALRVCRKREPKARFIPELDF